MMKQIVKSLLAVAVCCTLLFTTACGERNANAQGNNTARGRYVETELTLPEGHVKGLYLQLDGSCNLLLYDYGSVPLMYNTTDFANWQAVDTSWYEAMQDENLKHVSYDDSGVLYVLTQYGLDEYTVYRVGAEGSAVEKVPIDWYRAPDNESRLDVNHFELLANGDFLMNQTRDNAIVQYGSDGAFKGIYDTSYETSLAVNGSTFAILDMQGSVRIYDGESRELTDQVEMENYVFQSSGVYYGQNGILYVQNSSGLYRLNPGGSLWEKIIDGELSSMSLPGLGFIGLVELWNGDFCLPVGDDKGKFSILKYHYDPDLATLPEHELVVYTLTEHDIVRMAAVKYQNLHPDTKINIQVGSGDGIFIDSATTSDLLRALNTELLAGKGPDILILDGMNVESYIDKGTLLDLSEMVGELTAGGNMVEAVLRTYEKDGRICALPVKYYLPIMVAEEQVAAEIETLEDLARYAEEHPERGIMGDLRPETLLEALLPASAPTWVVDGAIDTEQLSAFLQAMYSIINTGAESYVYEDNIYGHGDGLPFNYSVTERFHYAYGRNHMYLGTMKGIHDVSRLYPLLEPQVNIQPLPDPRTGGIITYLPGQQEKSYVPVTIAGINVNSAQVERGKDFLNLLLSDAVQYDGSKGTGFAVSITAQEKEAANSMDAFIGDTNEFIENETLFASGAPVELQQQVIRLAQGVENPSTMDENLKTMIINGAKGYLMGEKDLEQAIADVEEATKLYLAE